MMFNRKRVLPILGIGISLFFLWIAFRNLHPGEVWTHIRTADPGLLLVAAAIFFVAVALISMRWGFLLRAIQPIPLPDLMALVSIGYAGNNIYPLRSGEVLRIVLLQRQHGVPIARATTTVVIERVFDGLVMLSFIMAALLLTGLASPEIQTMANVGAPPVLAALLIFFMLATRADLMRRLLTRVASWLPERLGALITRLGDEIISGFEGLRSPLDLAGAVVTSYLCWMVKAGVHWIVAFAFGLETSYPIMLMVVGVVNLAGLIPASPGMFGVFEAAVLLVLVAAGYPESVALAYGLVVHMVIWLPVTLVGLGLLLRMGLGLGAIQRAEELKAVS